MKLLHKTSKTQHYLINLLVISSSICAIYILVSVPVLHTSKLVNIIHSSSSSQQVSDSVTNTTTLDHHLVFGIASSGTSWPKRKEYTKLWWNSNMRGCVFLDTLPNATATTNEVEHSSLPPLCVSQDTSGFRYTYRGGMRSAIRVARVVKELVALNHSDARWYVFGDDDTVFFPVNLVKTLSKYDHRLWYYIGANSESYKQNWFFGFGMAFGGGGFAISYSLAQVLAKVFDSCIQRYPHLYGSDARVYSCITELGVGLTHEPGFHQVDLRGNAFGLLAAHPLTPLLSLHHPDNIDPIFPNMTTRKALQHLFEAVNVDSQRILQQTVCYDKRLSWTISVSWGYVVQIFQNHVSLPEVVKVQETFKRWTNGTAMASLYSFNTIEFHRDPCKRPTIFYMDNLSYGKDDGNIISSYRKHSRNCSNDVASKKIPDVIRVATEKLDLHIKQLQSPRRHCCDVLPSSVPQLMEIAIRECQEDELIHLK